MEKTMDELREIFLQELDPKLAKKLLKRGKKLNLENHPDGKPYSKKVMKFGYDTIGVVLGRKPTDSELQNILILWREAEEQATK